MVSLISSEEFKNMETAMVLILITDLLLFYIFPHAPCPLVMKIQLFCCWQVSCSVYIAFWPDLYVELLLTSYI